MSPARFERSFTVALALMLALAFTRDAGGAQAPIGRPAPEWMVSRWLNDGPGTVAELRGKVVIVEFFQLWCPGCNRFSIPLMREWKKKYAGREDIRFVSIHTVFEGHDVQTEERLERFIVEKGMDHPVGVDAYVRSREVPETMLRYRTGGTPTISIIDRRGIVRFQRLGSFDVAAAERLIDSLLAARAEGTRRASEEGR